MISCVAILKSSVLQIQIHVDFKFKGTVHPKMKILSFTQPQVDPNLYECVCSEHKEDILKKVCNQAVLGHH